MKKRLLQILKVVIAFLLFVTVVIVVAVVWPMPEIPLPGQQSGVLIKSINIIDVKTGEIFSERMYGLMAGTDVTGTYVFPGFSLHTELKDLAKCGLSNLEALQAATITPAKYCNLEQDYGSIEVGKMADLIILSQNPLNNIKNTKSIEGVLLNGISCHTGTQSHFLV